MWTRFLLFAVPLIKIVMAYRLVAMSYKVVVRIAIFAVLVALFLAVLATIQTLCNSITPIIPAPVVTAYQWIIPSNFLPCVTAIISTQTAIWAWHWKKYAIEFASEGV